MTICSHLFSFLISQWVAVHPPNSFFSENEEDIDWDHEKLLQDHREKRQCSAFKQTMTEVAAGVATCCAFCCCCPLAIVDILILGLVQAPYRLGKESFRKLKRKTKFLIHRHAHSTKEGANVEDSLWLCKHDSAHWEDDESMASSGSKDPGIISQAFLSAGGLTAGYILTCQCGCTFPRIPHKSMRKLLLDMRRKLRLRNKSSNSTPSPSPSPCATSISLSDESGSHESTPLQPYACTREEDRMTGYNSDFGLEWLIESSNSPQASGHGPMFELFWNDYLDKREVGFWRPMYSSHQD